MRDTLRSLVTGTVMIAAGLLSAQNAYLTNYYLPRFIRTNTDNTIAVRVRNLSSTPLTTFRVDWRWNNDVVNEGPWQSTTGITGNQYWPYTHPVPFNRPTAGAGVLKIWVVGMGETNPANDTLTFPVTAIASWVEKTVLLDAWTATWCPNCPPANSTTNLLDAQEGVIVAKHHAVDEYSTGTSSTYFGQYNVTYTPAGVMDQGEYGLYAPNPSYDLWEAQLTERQQGVSPAGVLIDATVNPWTRELSITVSAGFEYAFNGEFTLNAYLLEDDVPGNQQNAPANYVHQQVVREVFGGVQGQGGVVPASPVAGTLYSTNWSRVLPVEWNIANLRVVGFISHRQNGTAYTLNAAEGALLPVGIAEAATTSPLRFMPNPTEGVFQMQVPDLVGKADLLVHASDGRLVASRSLVLSGGVIDVADLTGLAPGTYRVTVRTTEGERSGTVVLTAR